MSFLEALFLEAFVLRLKPALFSCIFDLPKKVLVLDIVCMSKLTKVFKSFFNLLLPIAVLLFLFAVGCAIWLVYGVSEPPKNGHLVTPEKFAQLSSRGAQVTDETWDNLDGTQTRGWLLRGSQDAPAVILLHRYGTDRSHVLNLGVKLNETTNFTVIMPDLRGHGIDSLTARTSFGGAETEDILTLVEYLRNLKVKGGAVLVGKDIGIYGVEMGALTAISTAAIDREIKALALESVPASSDDLVSNAVTTKYPFGSFLTSRLAVGGTYLYYLTGNYNRKPVCDVAKDISDRQVLLLSGPNTPQFQTSTSNLSSCFPNATKVKAMTDLTPSGFDLTRASLEQVDFYDQQVIFFFKENLGNEEEK